MALRLMDFVSENKLEEEKELFKAGPRVQDRGPNEKPLFEILKDNKDKKDAEFNEKFKHRPPKALDDDETEFLESVEMHKRELERQRVEEDTEQLINFQAALASRTITAEEPRSFSQRQERPEGATKNKRPVRALPISVKIKPLPKRNKVEPAVSDGQSRPNSEEESVVRASDAEGDHAQEQKAVEMSPGGLIGLVSYGNETDEDED